MIIEPSADLREMAATQYQMYRAWVEAGFTEDQALQLLTTVVQGLMSNGGGGAQ